MLHPLKLLDSIRKKKLSNNEFQYMEFIWNHSENENGVNSSEIYEYFNTKSRNYTGKTLSIIARKGYINFERIGRHYLYFPIVTKDEYEKALLIDDLNKYGSNRLAVAFSGNEQGDKEIEKIRDDLNNGAYDDD